MVTSRPPPPRTVAAGLATVKSEASPLDLRSGRELKEAIGDAHIVLWGDVNHAQGNSISALNATLPALHELGFRQLYVEFEECAAAPFAKALANPDVKREDLAFTRHADEWLEVIKTLQRLGAAGETWTIVPVDFNTRENHVKALCESFRDRPGELTWSGRPLSGVKVQQPDDFYGIVCTDETCRTPTISRLQAQARERSGPLAADEISFITGVVLYRALGDSRALKQFTDTWRPKQKTVVFYGVGHGLSAPLYGATDRGDQVGFLAHHLRARGRDDFRSIFPIPKGEWNESLLRHLPPGDPVFEAREVPPPVAKELQDSFLAQLTYLDDKHRDLNVPKDPKFGDSFDVLWVQEPRKPGEVRAVQGRAMPDLLEMI